MKTKSSNAWMLAAWGLAGPGAVVFVVAGIYLPRQEYGAAIVTLLVGSVLYVPWIAACCAEMKCRPRVRAA